jgi:transmembrane sensor
MKATTHQDTRLAEEAAEWLTRLNEEPDTDSHADFVAWLKRSPRHMEEFLLVSTTYRLFRGIDPERQIDVQALVAKASADVLRFPTDASAAPEISIDRNNGLRPRRLRPRRLRIAAVVAGLIVVGGVLTALNTLRDDNYSTHTGEQRSLRLEDGSLVHLNTRSRVSVSFSDAVREIRLLEGEALFAVQLDAARPFRVLTRDAVVQAVGTQFNVYERAEGTRVSVVDGRVKVIDHRSKPVLLSAGEQVSVSLNGGIAQRATADIATAVAWRQRRLAFHGATLADVVAEFNRYNEFQLHIEGDGNLGRRITAVFNADEPQALLEFLEREPSVRLERRGDAAVIHAAQGGG